MKKTFLFFSVLLLAMPMVMAQDESSDRIELGLGLSPNFAQVAETTTNPDGEQDLSEQLLLNLHAGYFFMNFFYATLNSVILPPELVAFLAKDDLDDQGPLGEDIYRPGMLNMLDVGVRLQLGQFGVYGMIGLNQVHIYRTDLLVEKYGQELVDETLPGVSANIKVGGSFDISDAFSVHLFVFSMQSDLDAIGKIFSNLFSEDEVLREQAGADFGRILYPSLQVTLNL